MSRIALVEEIILLGEFSARVGRDNDVWSGSLGPHGVDNMIENGQRPLEMRSSQNLLIVNTFFQTKLRQAVTWRHTTSGHWHKLELVIAGRSSRPKFLHTRSYHSANCNSDHALVCSKVRLAPQSRPRMTQGSSKRLDISRLTSEDTRRALLDGLALAIDVGMEYPSIEEE